MKINGNEIRINNIIEHQNSLWIAVKTNAVKPGKGGAFNQVELKNLLNGSKLNQRFRASETVERVRLEQKLHTFLYKDGDMLVFMNSENYEQINLEAGFIGKKAAFLTDGMQVQLEFHEQRPISVSLPQQVTLEITQTEPVVKGQTAANSYKPAVLENGVRSSVPPFINVGERIIVMTEDGSYVKRAD
ncbi:MAG: elongation factor P [Robiginitomaculum sp.]